MTAFTNSPSPRAKHRRFLWVLFIVLIVIGISIAQGMLAPWFFMQSPATKMAYVPKTGRVVDSVTGTGVPDVTLIVSGYYSAQINKASVANWLVYTFFPIDGRTARNELYTIVTKTDQHGNFSVEEMHDQTWDSVKNQGGGLISYSLTPDWNIRLIKFGYVPEQDSHLFKANKIVSSDDKPVEIEGLKMRPAKSGMAGFKEEMSSYSYALHVLLPTRGPAGDRDRQVVTTETTALAKQAYKYFESEICALGADENIDLETISTILWFSPNKDRAMKLLNPDLWETEHGTRAHGTVGEHIQFMDELKGRGNLDKRDYKSGDVCFAMRAKQLDRV